MWLGHRPNERGYQTDSLAINSRFVYLLITENTTQYKAGTWNTSAHIDTNTHTHILTHHHAHTFTQQLQHLPFSHSYSTSSHMERKKNITAKLHELHEQTQYRDQPQHDSTLH